MILVTGASGHLGQLVLHHLSETLAIPTSGIIAASRDTKKLNDWAKKGVQLRTLDFEQPETLAAAFAGVDRVLLISTDALDRPGRRLAQHQAAIAAMEKAGVNHVVYTSMPMPENSPLLLAPDHEKTEQALAKSAIPGWTVLRNHWYFENLALYLPSVFKSGIWYSADEGQPSADISRNDLARAAATVLAGPMAGKRTFTLSGPQALTRAEVVQQINVALGKKLEVIPVSVDDWVMGAVADGLPEPLARVYASFDTNTAAGRVATVTDDFRQITGISPQSFGDWLNANQTWLKEL